MFCEKIINQLSELYLEIFNSIITFTKQLHTQMFKSRPFYLILLLSLTFGACKKSDVDDGKDYITLGTSAHDLLASTAYTSLTIEIQYMPGYAPDATSIQTLQNFLNNYLNKPGGIKIVEEPIPASGKSSLSLTDVVAIEKKYRTVFTGNNHLGVHILITDGNYETSGTFGTAYWNTSFCLFGKTVWDNSGSAGEITHSQLLGVLFEHEFGHLLGLVNQGSPMQTNHLDGSNGAHCINKNCLMYYDIETASNLSNSALPTLDANCIADLKANGGK